jgi:uncharacterized FAD-dependent dehydrogenase
VKFELISLIFNVFYETDRIGRLSRILPPFVETMEDGTFTYKLTSETIKSKAMNYNETVKNEPAVHANVGEHIGYELGAKMIKDYYDTYNEAGSQFVGRTILEKILTQPDCIGIRIYKALNEAGQKTYVITGVDSSGKAIIELSAVNPVGVRTKSDAIIADRNINMGWWDLIL